MGRRPSAVRRRGRPRTPRHPWTIGGGGGEAINNNGGRSARFLTVLQEDAAHAREGEAPQYLQPVSLDGRAHSALKQGALFLRLVSAHKQRVLASFMVFM